ncbi:MAG: cysteine--tRNA ligase [Patescibacteria group bacterium]|nr:cysteine--tRNA ligase [Patescibacteria group bacterium]
MIKLYNSFSREKEIFTPIGEEVRLYTCGPTVYDYAHIGNLRTYLFEDTLKRVLLYNGLKVKHVMNITDVGHLVSDADTGEDKMEKRAKERNQTAWDISEYYTKTFKQDLKKLNIIDPDIYIKATDTIKEQIDLIKKIEENGFTYTIKDGVYFDTSKLESYGKMANLKEREAGKRIDIKDKKNPTDFALWKFSPPDEKRQMEWDSPWGIGFPGWHTECVAMSEKCLGIPFDIHCGGIDHIEIHHPNEIAQSEAAYGKNPANFWMHGEFLNLKDGKMAKSKGNITTISSFEEEGISPLAYRYLNLTAHYRTKLTFSKEAVLNAEKALFKMKEKINPKDFSKEKISEKYKKKFQEVINDDLNIPKALSVAFAVLKDKELSSAEKSSTLIDFDKVFGLKLDEKQITAPKEVVRLAEERKKARLDKNFQLSDEIREKIKKMGYLVEDTDNEYKIRKIS